MTFRFVEVNGDVALLGWESEELTTAALFDFGAEGIAELRIVRNPDKLKFLETQSR